jgi:hypothetical protein
MPVKFANNVSTAISVGISSSETAISVATGSGSLFPTLTVGDYFFATLISTSGAFEIVKCTARSGDILTVLRGQDNTVATAFPANSRIEMRINAAALEALLSDADYLLL